VLTEQKSKFELSSLSNAVINSAGAGIFVVIVPCLVAE